MVLALVMPANTETRMVVAVITMTRRAANALTELQMITGPRRRAMIGVITIRADYAIDDLGNMLTSGSLDILKHLLYSTARLVFVYVCYV